VVKRVGTGCGVLLSSLGLTAGFLAGAFLNLTPLSAGFSERAATTAAVGAVLFTVGTGITLGALFRQGCPWIRRLFLVLFLPGALAWCSFCGLFYFAQDLLLFSPRELSEARYAAVLQGYPHAEEIYLPVGENTLHGWLLPPKIHGETTPLILLFYGQGGEASRYFRLAENVPEAAWALINYRGYGWSTGVPNEAAFFADALAIYDYFAHHPLIDQNRIVALAGSMGTGVAVYLSAQRPLAGVVLFSPYDSIAEAAQDLIPLLPAKLLIRQRFEVVPYAQSTQAPALAIVGEDDAVIRPDRSKSLMNSWARPSETVVIPGGTHYSIYEEETAWAAVRSFLHSLDVI